MALIVRRRGRVHVPAAGGALGSLRFYGNDNANGNSFIDRVEIRIDNPARPADIGATDFTIEGWLRANAGNNAAAITAGANYDWTQGNIFWDRDRQSAVRALGASLTAGIVTFGVKNASDVVETWRASTDIRNGAWHHVAIQRAEATGAVQIYIDGTREVNDSAGPTGDISYPNGATVATKDPFLVLGAEKHDFSPATFPSYFGYMSELRLSSVVRYSGATITVPSAPFSVDGDTLALYHFNDGNGTTLTDADGNASPGTLNVGGSANGPTWETASPF